jgi:hypothetical protein
VYYGILERKWKGTSRQDAFLFYGYDHGLVVVEIVDDPNSNDGAMVVALQTPEGFTESLPPKVYLAGSSYTTTETDVWSTKLG